MARALVDFLLQKDLYKYSLCGQKIVDIPSLAKEVAKLWLKCQRGREDRQQPRSTDRSRSFFQRCPPPLVEYRLTVSSLFKCSTALDEQTRQLPFWGITLFKVHRYL